MDRKLVRPLGLSLAVLVLLGGFAELGFRLLQGALGVDAAALDGYQQYLLTGMMKGYEARAYTVFQRPRGNGANSIGFYDFERTRARVPGVPRIACLGGSTTEGGNARGRRGSYPFLLERTLEQRTGRDFEVINAGISGWTTAEMVAAWFLTLQDFAPDVLVLHEGVNDLVPRFSADYQADYSHWRRSVSVCPDGGLTRPLVRWSKLYVYLRSRAAGVLTIQRVSTYPNETKEPLVAEGKLPRATSLAFRRNMLSIARDARANGSEVVLVTLPTRTPFEIGEFWRYGIAENNEHLRELAAEHGFVLVDAARAFEARPELTEEFSDLVHLSPEGNRAKAEVVADALAGWIAGLSSEGARPPRETP
jgi:lysophospholipase L1-like esterase